MSKMANIKKVLVILSPDLIKTDKPMESALIRRAISLAKITGCELEMFHACYEDRPDHGLFTSDEERQTERDRLTAEDATRLAEMAMRLKDEGVNVRYDVRWDNPRVDAILRKTARAHPDLVMKQSREHSFHLGITTNTDWELARRSPVHIWFVNNDIEDINRVVAAVGHRGGIPADVTKAADYELFRTAGFVGDAFNAEIYPVNAYQVPVTPVLVGGVEMVAVPTDDQQHLRAETVKHHDVAVKALTRHFNISIDNVHICEGPPNKVISEVTKAVKADMIVMGARNIGRLERLVNSVTLEPVMAEMSCDILVVKDRDLSGVPKMATDPGRGTPKYNLEHAIIDPENTFESPLRVANVSEISIGLRKRILQAWEFDIRAEMEAENEGGAIGDINVNTLDQIVSAKEILKMKENSRENESMRLSQKSA